MSDGTPIEWTDATVNAVNGCSVVSPGCTNCYAMRAGSRGLPNHPSTGLTVPSKAGHVWTGEVRLNERALLQPLRWRRSRRIFWNAHGDLFHDSVPDEWIDRCFAVMGLTPQHIHQVLTKRPERMRDYLTQRKASQPLSVAVGDGTLTDHPWNNELKVPANVWIGTSVEDQLRADDRIPHLLATPAAVRFLSCEPLLGPLNLARVRRFPKGCADKEFINAIGGRMWSDQAGVPNPDPAWAYPGVPFSDGGRGLDWLIVGGESGTGSRPMHPSWARALRDQCAVAGVPFFFKQWGEWGPDIGGFDGVGGRIMDGAGPCAALRDGVWSFAPDGYAMPLEPGDGDWLYRLGKRANGRLLDDVEHNGMPA